MKKILGLSICLAISGLSQAEGQPQPITQVKENPVAETLVTVNGVPITGMELLVFNAQQGGSAIESEQAQIALMNQAINTIIVAQAAEAGKLDQNPRVKTALNMARLQVLAEMQIQDWLAKNPVSEEKIKAVYDEMYKPENMQEYHVAHILVDSEDKAKSLIAELDKGGNFAELAKANSSDTSKDEGGDLGWLEPGQVIQPFAEAMTALKKGEYSKAPVSSQFGWHVILLSDTRAKQPPTLDEAKGDISTRLQQQTIGEYIGGLRKAAKIEVPSAPAPTPEPTAEPAPAVATPVPPPVPAK